MTAVREAERAFKRRPAANAGNRDRIKMMLHSPIGHGPARAALLLLGLSLVAAGCANKPVPVASAPVSAPAPPPVQCPIVESDRCWGGTITADIFFRTGSAALAPA